jgi:hypothetical protein
LSPDRLAALEPADRKAFAAELSKVVRVPVDEEGREMLAP